VTRCSVMYLPVFLLILYQINTATGNQRCQAINGAHVYCHGFCCPGFGCCPYSSLWYVWLFLALFILMCMCSCASCGARRYRVIRNRRNNAPFLSYNEDARLYRAERNKNCTNTQFNNLLCENGIPNRNYNTTPNIITTGTTTSREAKPIYPQEPPPAYATVIGPSAPPPPPYSYH
jgi:hypothetical protein